ncbi:unnamed protein product [Closterium sp. NIES-65]|nr:unnamed protein product [Closterium sp. NIES-65]
MASLPEDLGMIATLQYLHLYTLDELSVLPDSLGLLSGLKELRIVDCWELEGFPQSVSAMGSLTSLVLDGCAVRALPEDIGQLQNLSFMKLSCSKLVDLPESFGQLGKLRGLILHACYDLGELPASFSNLASLEVLEMYGAPYLEELPPGFEKLPQLSRLELFNCAIGELPDEFGGLANLRVFKIGARDTYNRRGLDADIYLSDGPRSSEAEAVSESDLHGSCGLYQFPPSLVHLARLEQLIIDRCELLKGLPMGMGNLSSLKVLEVINCECLQVFPSLLPTLAQTNEAGTCVAAEAAANAVIADIIAGAVASNAHLFNYIPLPSLQRLKISGCCDLQYLPEGLAKLPRLEDFTLADCNKPRFADQVVWAFTRPVDPLPLSAPISLPRSLTSISISYTFGFVRYLPESFLSLSRLTSLNIQGLHSLKQLIAPPTLHQIPAEWEGEATSGDPPVITSPRLTVAIGQARLELLSSLTCLNISHTSLPALPDNLSDLRALKALVLEECSAMPLLPACLPDLSNLEQLTIKSLPLLTHLPENLGQLNVLSLHLESCKDLQRLPPSLTLMPSLKFLSIVDCPRITSLPDSISSLSRLASLKVERLPGLHHVPPTLPLLPSLVNLSLKGCIGLRALPNDLGGLSCLREVDLDGCSQLETGKGGGAGSKRAAFAAAVRNAASLVTNVPRKLKESAAPIKEVSGRLKRAADVAAEAPRALTQAADEVGRKAGQKLTQLPDSVFDLGQRTGQRVKGRLGDLAGDKIGQNLGQLPDAVFDLGQRTGQRVKGKLGGLAGHKAGEQLVHLPDFVFDLGQRTGQGVKGRLAEVAGHKAGQNSVQLPFSDLNVGEIPDSVFDLGQRTGQRVRGTLRDQAGGWRRRLSQRLVDRSNAVSTGGDGLQDRAETGEGASAGVASAGVASAGVASAGVASAAGIATAGVATSSGSEETRQKRVRLRIRTSLTTKEQGKTLRKHAQALKQHSQALTQLVQPLLKETLRQRAGLLADATAATPERLRAIRKAATATVSVSLLATTAAAAAAAARGGLVVGSVGGSAAFARQIARRRYAVDGGAAAVVVVGSDGYAIADVAAAGDDCSGCGCNVLESGAVRERDGGYSEGGFGAKAGGVTNGRGASMEDPPDPTGHSQEGVWDEAVARGISEETVREALEGLQPLPAVVSKVTGAAEVVLTARQYVDRIVSDARVLEGRQVMEAHRKLLAEIEEIYGVPANVMTALWGIESSYGKNMGKWDAIQALLTLAYRTKQPRRAAFFREELMEALSILQNNHGPSVATRGLPAVPAVPVPAAAADTAATAVGERRVRLLGSYAGAMGQCQFMPSSFNAYAVDYDKDGRRDIWTSVPDVLASMANYLKCNRWRRGEPVGVEVVVPPDLPLSLLKPAVKLTVAEWQQKHGPIAHSTSSFLSGTVAHGCSASTCLLSIRPHLPQVAPDGPAGVAYLACHNFHVILRYNPSSLYGLAIAELARRLG